jgi:predicted transposase YbfD/YdcC
MVSAWATNQRIVLGQQATEEKSNEITAIPLLLKNLDLNGALVTIDAMGTQTKIRPGDPRWGWRLRLVFEGKLAGHPRRDRDAVQRAAARRGV